MVQKAREALDRNDYAVALALYRRAADQGSAVAQANLGWMYDHGKGVPQDFAQALYWFRKAADQGDANAQYSVAAYYRRGLSVKQDYAQAIQWYRKAAAQGLAPAQFEIGTLYRSGEGVPRDYAQALLWFRKAADQGLAVAQLFVGLMYMAGEGVPADYVQAMIWFRKVVDENGPTGGVDPVHDADKINPAKARAQFAIATLYERGVGVPKDIAEAISRYKKANELGYPGAQAKLAELHEPTSGNAGSINLICQNAREKSLVFVDAALKSVKVQTGTLLEYKDGADQYVTITDSAIEFGCRKIRSQEEVIGDGLAWMLGSKTKDGWGSTLCLARNRIDRTTGIWTATGSGSLASIQNDTAECAPAPTRR
jgi:TPR repeat protein